MWRHTGRGGWHWHAQLFRVHPNGEVSRISFLRLECSEGFATEREMMENVTDVFAALHVRWPGMKRRAARKEKP